MKLMCMCAALAACIVGMGFVAFGGGDCEISCRIVCKDDYVGGNPQKVTTEVKVYPKVVHDDHKMDKFSVLIEYMQLDRTPIRSYPPSGSPEMFDADDTTSFTHVEDFLSPDHQLMDQGRIKVTVKVWCDCFSSATFEREHLCKPLPPGWPESG